MNKEIMAMIQPYMDVTLSEGCYIKSGLYPTKIIGFEEIDEGIGYIIEYITIDTLNNINIEVPEDEVTALGHYDITAVLKFVKDREEIYDIRFQDNEFEIVCCDECQEGILPNKPLHLYTEEEQTNLLELLKKLG